MGRGVVGVGDELDGAGAVVARRARQGDRLLAQRAAQRFVDDRRRRLLDDLLMAPLERALALAERDDVAVRVADHLHLDVPRTRQEALEEHAVVAEPGGRLTPRRGHRGLEVLGALDDAHAAPAAARGRLDQHGVLGRLGRVRRHRGHAGSGGRLLRAHLVAHQLDRLRRRPDEDHARLRARAGERGVLGQEAVAGMERVGPHRHDRVDVQVRRNAHRRIGLAHVRRARVHVRVDRDGADPEPPAASGSRGARSRRGWRRPREPNIKPRGRGR